MQDMVPELAIDEFNTPPLSSPVLATRTGSKAAAVLPTNSAHHESTRDSFNLHDIQLGKT